MKHTHTQTMYKADSTRACVEQCWCELLLASLSTVISSHNLDSGANLAVSLAKCGCADKCWIVRCVTWALWLM